MQMQKEGWKEGGREEMFSAGNLFPYDFFFQLVIISSSSSSGSSLPRDLNTEPQKPVLDGNECVMQKKKKKENTTSTLRGGGEEQLTGRVEGDGSGLNESGSGDDDE